MPAESKVTKSSKPAATVKKVVAKTATTATTTTKAAPVSTTTKKSTTTTTKKVVTPVAEPVETFEEVKKMTPIEPPHSIKINYYKKSIVAKITLHKIPDKCINLHPTAKKFYLDTLKFSKKFVLDIPYPEDVTVDDEKATCTFDHDILTVFIPITSPLQEPVKKVDPKNKNNKSNSAPVLIKRKQSEPTTTDKPAKKQTVQKKQKVEEKQVEEKQVEEEQTEESSEQTETTTTQKKKKFVDNDSAIEFMTQISNEQEQKANQKIKDEKKKTQQLESKVENKQVKKASQIEKKVNILKKLKGDETTPSVEEEVVIAKPTTTKVSKKPAPVATTTKKVTTPVEEEGTPSKKSVSFGEKVKVNVRNIPKVGKGHKLN